MSEIAKWGGHSFEVSARLIRGFNNLTITSSSEKKEQEDGEAESVTTRTASPPQISFTVLLDAHFGCDVRNEAMSYISEAQNFKTDYLYIGGKKLVGAKYKLISATVKDVRIATGGLWVRCSVDLAMEQVGRAAEWNDKFVHGSGVSGGKYSGSRKETVDTAPVTPKVEVQSVVDRVGQATQTAATAVGAKPSTPQGNSYTNQINQAWRTGYSALQTAKAAADASAAAGKIPTAHGKLIPVNDALHTRD